MEVIMKSTNILTSLTLLLLSVFATAEDIMVPYSFSSGTTISSAEMNENFSTVVTSINQQALQVSALEEGLSAIETALAVLTATTEANNVTLNEISSVLYGIGDSLVSIDTKLTTTSPATVSDQLICRGQPRNLATETMLCLQASSPSSTRSLTLSQIYAEGWIAVSVGGPDDYYAGYIFQK